LKKTVEKVKYTENDKEFTVEVTVYEPLGESSKPPLGMIYIHGGGMAFLDGRGTMEWGSAIHATQGCIAATVHFTNSTEAAFPRGRNDCVAAIQWFCKTYTTSGVCLYGESGGGNLGLSSALQLKELGQMDLIDALYLSCPYLHPGYGCPEEFPEDVKQSEDEFGLDAAYAGDPESKRIWSFLVRGFFQLYTPDEDWKNKFAWPYFCEVEDFKGLPPTWIVSNECDSIKDLGKQCWKKLCMAGVKAFHKEISGTFHYSQCYDELHHIFELASMRTALEQVLVQKARAKAMA